MFKPRFLVVSIGNPLPKYESLHSAAHFVLEGLARQLGPMRNILHQPSQFNVATLGKERCLILHHDKYILVQSPTLMNISGTFVRRAWAETLGQHDPASLSLVILHDELEKDFGDVQLTSWQRSARGHNGLKSIKRSLSQEQYPTSPLARIAIGIGRPMARDSTSVSDYVLKQITQEQRRALEEDAPPKVARLLRDLEEEWAAKMQR